MSNLDIEVLGMRGVLAMLARFQQPELNRRAQKAVMAGAKVLRAPIKAAAPVGPRKKLKASVRVTKGRRDRPSAVVGPRAGHRHLVIRGHRIVTHTGRNTGRRSRANDFVSRAVAAHEGAARAAIAREIYR
jgi:hypothetical protein